MSPLNTTVLRFLRNEQGITTVEYAIAGALVAAALVVTFSDLGAAVAARIDTLATVIS